MKKSLLALIAISLCAQQPNFTSEARLVIVNLSAKDKSGKPILTLISNIRTAACSASSST